MILGVQLHWDQFPSSTRLKLAIVLELHLRHGCPISVPTYKCCRETTTNSCMVFVGSAIREVPGHVGRAPEEAGTI